MRVRTALMVVAVLAVIAVYLAMLAIMDGKARKEESEMRVDKLAERLRAESKIRLKADLENARGGNTTAVKELGTLWQMDYVCLDWAGNRYGVIEVDQGFMTNYASQNKLEDLLGDCFEVSEPPADRRL